MQREIMDKAIEIIKTIETNKKCIKYLQKYHKQNGMTLYGKAERTYSGYQLKEDIHFEPWEIRLMIHNKKQRIQALEKQLEEL